MRLSKYALVQYNENKIELYHLINRTALSISCDFSLLNKPINHILPLLDEDTRKLLTNSDFIIDNTADEYEKYLISKEVYKYSDYVNRFVIHLNYDCNLRCGYCYQNVIENKIIMNDLTMFQIIQFISNVVTKTSPELIDICFIGGEPTLHSKRIIDIMEALNRDIQTPKIYSIVTNGTFGNKNILKKMIQYGLKDFLITLDGPKEIHDSLRVSESGRGSYDKITKNLKMMQEYFPEVSVNINCNLNLQNIKHIEELLMDLEYKQIVYPVVYSFVIDTQSKKFRSTIKETDLIWKNIHQLSNRYGYRFSPFYRDTYLTCSLFQKNNFTIGADGYLYACIEAVGTEKYRQCHVNLYNTIYYQFQQAKFSELNNVSIACRQCKFLPVCDGGCLYRKNNGDFVCPKKEFEQNDVEMVFDYYFKEK